MSTTLDQTYWGVACPHCGAPILVKGIKVFDGPDWDKGPKGKQMPWVLDFGKDDEPIEMMVPGVNIGCPGCGEAVTIGFAVFAMPGQAKVAANVTGKRNFQVHDGGLDG